jgi:Tfp pilus assembly protein FimT
MTSNQHITNKSPKGNAPAFTLVELLLVMTLLTVVVSISMPMLANFFRGRALDNEARRILALTRHAQSLAISGGLPMVIWYDERNRKYGMEEDSAYNNNNENIYDKNNIYYNIDNDVVMEYVFVRRPSPVPQNDFTGSRGRFTSVPIAPTVNNAHRNFPSIRFLEDGTISEDSPEFIKIKGRAVNDVITLGQIRHRIGANDNRPNTATRSQGYEIRTSTNLWDETDLYK